MSDHLKRYDVVIPGRGGNRVTTLQLTDAAAQEQGLLGKHVDASKKAAPANKAAKPAANKSRSRAKKPAAPAAAPAADESSAEDTGAGSDESASE